MKVIIMKFADRPLLFIDCQTTGMRPPKGHLLEIAWQCAEQLKSFLVRLPDGHTIPARVREITGLKDEDLTQAAHPCEISASLFADIPKNPIWIIHYAQFEKPFLNSLLSEFGELNTWPGDVLCTYMLSKRLFPTLPSSNLRATAGYFGPPVLGPNRAATFVRATVQIWQGLESELLRQGLSDWNQLSQWLQQSKTQARARSSKSKTYEYRVDRLKRLNLPDQPGVYRMLAKNGEVLYVGKATSLKNRVNSYFRGKKGKDARKLEMLAQVWDLNVTTTTSPLTAALLEVDEIKKYDPPYNVVLKRGRRRIVFYSRDFSQFSFDQSPSYPLGPLRQQNWLEHLRLIKESLDQNRFQQIFFNPIDEDLLARGFFLFLNWHDFSAIACKNLRSLVALSLQLFKKLGEPDNSVAATSEENSSEEDLANDGKNEIPPTPEELAAKFERLFRRAGAEYWQRHRLTRLLNARVIFKVEDKSEELQLYRGHLTPAFKNDDIFSSAPWSGLDVETYDRISVLFSELKKYPHQIDRRD